MDFASRDSCGEAMYTLITCCSHLPVAPTGQGLARHCEDHRGVNATYNPLGFLSWGHGYLLGAAVGLPRA